MTARDPSAQPPDPQLGVLAGRRIVLGVCGGIAAYKAVEVCRRLVDAGALVVPVLTGGATRFVGATTFSALASEPARTSLWDDTDPIPHVRLGRDADVVVVAPATARLLGSYAAGISADLLTSTLLATRAPVVVCPAMHAEMWDHPAVQDNLAVLVGRGVHVVGPTAGRLAGGDVGVGRLADPAAIVAAVGGVLTPQDLAGVTILVTAGGTREAIDPVRFLGNRSSGKQGYALADEAARRGARVTVVATVDRPAWPGVEVVAVESAAEMESAVLARAAPVDAVIMAAAVADFRPKVAAEHKIKKSEGVPDIVLEPTPDILAAVAAGRRPGQVVVGFSAETDDLRANAAAKLKAKGADLIVANLVSDSGAGFGQDGNAVMLLGADGSFLDVPLTDKREVARIVIDAVADRLAVADRTPPPRPSRGARRE